MNNKSDIIVAVAALNKIAEIRQYGLQEDYSYLLSNGLVNDLNQEAFKSTGVDLLDDKKSLSFSQIDKYESFLDRIIEQSLAVKYSDSFLSDEIELLSRAQRISIDEFKALEIKSEDVARIVKEAFKSIGLTTPYIVPILRNPLKIQVIDDEQRNFLVLCRFEVKSRVLFVIFHLNEGVKVKYNGTPRTLKSAITDGEISRKKSIGTMSCFFFSADSKYIGDPINMFLRGITAYGKDITIGNTTKKFFLSGVSSSLLIKQGGEIVFHHGLAATLAGALQVEQTPTGYKYGFAYVLDVEKMLRNYQKMILL